MEQKEKIRGYRNNNPLNIRYNASNNWAGRVTIDKSDSQFEEFISLYDGYRAAFVLLNNYINKYGFRTIREIISKWAPTSENNTESYIVYVCNYSGIKEDATLYFSNPVMMIPIVIAMTMVECGEVRSVEPILRAYLCVYAEKHPFEGKRDMFWSARFWDLIKRN